MSSISLFNSSHDSDRAEHTLAQVAAHQAEHDEQVSRAFNLGAAYALVRVFECGCHYIDVHAYESTIPTRKAAPFSTFTSIHDFLRGPCVKSTCADIECPDWWYSDRGKGKYGIKDLEDWDEILGEAEEWEEKVESLVAAYRSLCNPIKEQLHDITYRHALEKMDWVLICPPMWDRQMLTEWCPEIQDAKEWRRRGLDMALNGAPHLFYEFCIDAAWASLRGVRRKVGDELEQVVRALQKRQDDMAMTIEIPRELIYPPSPESPVSPSTIPTLKMVKERSTSSKSSKYRRHLSVEAEIINAQAARKMHTCASEASVVGRASISSEPQASIGALDTPDAHYYNQLARTYLCDSPSRASDMVIEAPDECSQEVSRPSSPLPSSNLVPTPDAWRTAFSGVQNESSLRASAPDAVYSNVHPNVPLPSQAAAALYDAFAAGESISTWSPVSTMSLDISDKARSTAMDNDGWIENDWSFDITNFESVTRFVSNLVTNRICPISPQPASERPEGSSSIVEPRPLLIARSIPQISTLSSKCSREDVGTEVGDSNESLRPRKRSCVSRLSTLKAVPSYVELKELTGMHIQKVTEHNDTEDIGDAKATASTSIPIITTTFIITSIYSGHAVEDIIEAGSETPSSITNFSERAIISPRLGHSTVLSPTRDSTNQTDVNSKRSSRKTIAKAKGWMQNLRSLKPLRMFQRHQSDAGKSTDSKDSRKLRKTIYKNAQSAIGEPVKPLPQATKRNESKRSLRISDLKRASKWSWR